MFSSDENLSDHESLSDLSDLEERPYFRKMDKFDTVEIKELPKLPETDDLVELFDSTLREQYLKEGDKTKEMRDKRRDQTYKEILNWDLTLPPQNRVIYSSDLTPDEPPMRSELVDMILRSKKPKKCEFEVTPPPNFVGENDKILYPRGLQLTQNFTVFQKCKNLTMEPPKKGKKEPKNGEIMVEEIGKLRQDIADFQREMEEFSEKSRFLARAFKKKDDPEVDGHQIRLVQQGIVNQKKVYCFIKKYGNVNYNRMLGVTEEEEEEEEESVMEDQRPNLKSVGVQNDEEDPVQQMRRQLKYESMQRILADEKRILEEIKHFESFRTTNCSLEMQMALD